MQLDQTGKFLQQRYRIEKQIGQGGMGAVYVAVDERFGSTVAIKQTLCMDDNYRKAIEREARLLNSLKHVALPRVSDHFIEDNGQYIVMEYVQGEDLYCILEGTGKPFPAEQVLQWADQLLDALDFLHNQSNPVIHRDIKPQNLKVTHSGQIILLDFGLAKGNPTDAQNNTAAKSIFGYSRNYASLEQIQGTGTDPRSDLYSLAATLYHLVTGIPPEDALTRAMAVLSKQPDPLRPAHLVNNNVPAGLSVILQQTLDLNAANRPATAEALREMLRDHRKYEHLAAAAGTSIPVASGLHDQKTRLFHEQTAAAVSPLTDVKTDVLPTGYSQVTVAKPAVQFEKKPIAASRTGGGRKLAWSAAGLGMLLLSGAVIGGVLFYDSADVRGVVEENAVPAPVTSSDQLENANADLVTDVSTLSNDGETNVENAPSSNLTAPAPERKKEVAISSPTAPEPPVPRMVIEEDGERIVIEGDTIYMGNQKINAGRLETPPSNLDPRDRRPLPPGVRPPPESWRGLTPLQVRRLREALRKAANANANVAQPPKP